MRVNHLNIVVSDMERSLAFYVGLLGMRITFETELSGEWIDTVVGLAGVRARCVFVQPEGGGCRFELLQYIEPSGAAIPENRLAHTLGLRHLAVEVNDLDADYARLTAAGVEAISAPVTVPFRLMDGIRKRLCYLRDPDGVIVEICEHRLMP
ncbi:MAG: VOC family protein [Capsulimonadales bacterium]|nr:VOC family protein [Capsulimonadales bacterium]